MIRTNARKATLKQGLEMGHPPEAIETAVYAVGICCGGLVLSWLLGLLLLKARHRKTLQLWDRANALEWERARYRANAKAEWIRNGGLTHWQRSAPVEPMTDAALPNPPECPTCGSPLELQDGPLYGSRLLLCSGLDCGWAERLQEEA